MPSRKLRTAMERTYEPPGDPIAQRCIETTIQGWPVRLQKVKDRTDFQFISTGPVDKVSEAQFMAAFGSEDRGFVYGLIDQLADIGITNKSPDVEGFNCMLADVMGMAPRDPFDALICTQVAVVYSISMMFGERVGNARLCLDMEREEQSLCRLSRTSAALTETFDRHRNARDRKMAAQQIIADDTFRSERSGQDGKASELLMASHRPPEDPEFLFGLLSPVSVFSINVAFVRGAIKGMAPQDRFEEKICAQMAVVHSSAMKFAHRLTQAEDDLELQRAERSLNRLVRTFCALVGAFDHHRYGDHRMSPVWQVSNAEGAQRDVSDVRKNGIKMPGKPNGRAST